ncbi:two-component sensor histidine kinase [Actinoplanes sp. NBRC 101535]|nr:two-component sensor histidine kinase [Actinoplanes sp. NBRC 101535]
MPPNEFPYRDGMGRWLPPLAFVLAVARVAAAPVVFTDRPPDLLAYALVAAMCLALPVRDDHPAITLATVGVLFLVYHVLGYPGGAPAPPLWVALFAVGAASRRRAGFVVAGLLLAVDIQGRAATTGLGLLDARLDGSTGVFLGALLLGEVVRGRRERLATAAADREQRLISERVRIARELHDVTAHTLAVVAVQAGVAADLREDDPDGSGRALEAVRQAAGDAMRELRAAVGVLRDGSPESGPPPPTPALDRLPDLAAATGAVLISEGTPRRLPRAVEAAAYRIVQEAVANAIRHSGAGRIEVRLGYRPDGLAIQVGDDGRDAGGPPGNGLHGMVERATGLGGWLRAGPGPAGGFQVRGWIPG